MTSSRPAAERPLRIGLTARILYELPAGYGPTGKKLQYLEQGFARLVTNLDVLAFCVPELGPRADLEVITRRYVQELDGLVLQGGSDISPLNYGQQPLCDAWAGDMPRDVYELALLRECLRQGKPLLGICRGAQLINVAFGGTLHQDLATCAPHAALHRNAALYDGLHHDIVFEPASHLATLYKPLRSARVTSIHHQAVDRLGDGLVVEARSTEDGIVEAFRAVAGTWVRGVQWHPEFHDIPALLPSGPLMGDFVRACRDVRAERTV